MNAHGALRTVSLTLVALSWGCGVLVPVPPRVAGTGPAQRTHAAVAALEEEEYDVAERELRLLVSDCASGDHGREALLLLAAAQLDTGNPNGSPHTAAYLAASYLLLPDAAPTRLPLARSLYRLGTDLELADSAGSPDPPPVARRFDTCEEVTPSPVVRALPTTPAPRTAKIVTLHAELAQHVDSLQALEAEVDTRATRIAELNAEIERIRALLKSGLPGHTLSNRR